MQIEGSPTRLRAYNKVRRSLRSPRQLKRASAHCHRTLWMRSIVFARWRTGCVIRCIARVLHDTIYLPIRYADLALRLGRWAVEINTGDVYVSYLLSNACELKALSYDNGIGKKVKKEWRKQYLISRYLRTKEGIFDNLDPTWLTG